VSDKFWKGWCEKEMAGCAGGAHKFSREPKAWQPPEVYDKNNIRAIDSPTIVQIEAEKYKKLWRASAAGPEARYQGNAPQKLLAPEKLRRLARSYKRRTGVAPDGWHPRHVALLNDEALEVLALLYLLLEKSGHLPNQQRFVAIFLLDKPTGGTRPVGLFTAFYRLWAKARQEDAAAWAADHDMPFFAAGKGRSTTDPVWRQSVRNQTSKAQREHVASLCWDLRKFYETMDHDRMLCQARKHHFPSALVEVALNAYKMERTVTYQGIAAEGVFPSQGIVAGDSLSDVLVKLYYWEPLSKFAAVHDKIELEVYFDDIQLAARGNAAAVRARLSCAAADLKKLVEDDLGATLAVDKATVTADSMPLCDALRSDIGAAAGPQTELAQFLGVDNLLGRRRRVLKSGSRFKRRLKDAGRRRSRVKRLADGCWKGATRVFTAGLLPAAVYGVDTLGISNTELARLQALAL